MRGPTSMQRGFEPPLYRVKWGEVAIAAIAGAACVVGGAGVAMATRMTSITAVVEVFGILALVVPVAVIRRSLFVGSPTLSQLLGLSMAAAGLMTVTFNALRVTSWMTVSDLFLLGASLILLPSLVLRRSLLRELPLPVVACGGVLLFVTILSAFNSDSPRADLLSGAQFTAALVITPILIAVAITESRHLTWFAGLWIVSVAVNGAVAILDLTDLTSIGSEITGFKFANREAALTIHPNHLALVGAMALPVAVSYLMNSRRAVVLFCNGLVVLAIAAGVLASGSRAGFIGAGIGLIALAISQRKARVMTVVIILLVVAVLVVLVSPYASGASDLMPAVHRLSGTESIGDSDAKRLIYYQEAITEFGSNPFFGNGFRLVRGAHNIYLQLLQASGLLGLAAFLMFSATIIRTGIRLSRDGRLSHGERSLASALLAAVLVWLVVGLAQNQIYDRYLYVPGALLVALQILTNEGVVGQTVPVGPPRHASGRGSRKSSTAQSGEQW